MHKRPIWQQAKGSRLDQSCTVTRPPDYSFDSMGITTTRVTCHSLVLLDCTRERASLHSQKLTMMGAWNKDFDVDDDVIWLTAYG